MRRLGSVLRWLRFLAGRDLEALAQDCEARGEAGLAIAAIRKVLGRNSSYVRGWLKLARLYEASGELEIAYSAAGAAVAAARRPGGTAPLEIAALRNRGRLGIELGKLEASEADFREAFRLAKQNDIKDAMASCLDGLARIAETRGEAAKAATLRRQAAALGSGQAAALSE